MHPSVAEYVLPKRLSLTSKIHNASKNVEMGYTLFIFHSRRSTSSTKSPPNGWFDHLGSRVKRLMLRASAERLARLAASFEPVHPIFLLLFLFFNFY